MTSLIEIAINMRSEARRFGRSRQRLERGLRLTLRWKGPEREWSLSLTRDKTYPSAGEERICREAFKVPADARREQEIKPFGGFDWHIVRYHWTMLEQMPLDIQPQEARR